MKWLWVLKTSNKYRGGGRKHSHFSKKHQVFLFHHCIILFKNANNQQHYQVQIQKEIQTKIRVHLLWEAIFHIMNLY